MREITLIQHKCKECGDTGFNRTECPKCIDIAKKEKRDIPTVFEFEALASYLFGVREESMADVYKAMAYTRRSLLDIEDDGIRNVAADRHMTMLRITEWAGPGISGECTTEAKDRFFARRPGILFEIGDELRRLEREDQKNSEPSQDG